ncbi:CDP-glycerol glycerophosphotransferase family protein [Aeromonas sanarellii]
MVPSWRDQARGNSGSRDDRLTFSCQCHLGEQLRSTDDSATIIKKWQKKYPNNIHYVYKENGGQASARNLGMQHVNTEWVTFTDPDDILDQDYFYQIDVFAYKQKNNNIVMLCNNFILYFENEGIYKDSHPLKYRFSKGDMITPVNNLGKNMQLSASTAVFKHDFIIKNGIEFSGKIKPSFEDAHFVGCYLSGFNCGNIGFVSKAKYYYRKRSDGTSTLDTAWEKKELFHDVLVHGCIDMFNQYINTQGHIPKHIQRTVLYHLIWYFKRLVNNKQLVSFLSDDELNNFKSLLTELFNHIDTETIMEFELAGCWFYHKVALLGLFKKIDPALQIIYVEAFDPIKCMVEFRYFVRNIGLEAFNIDGIDVIPSFTKSMGHEFLGDSFVIERRIWVPISPEQQASNATLRVSIGNTVTRISLAGKQHNNGVSYNQIASHFESQKPKYKIDIKYQHAWLLMDRNTQADDNAEHLYRHIKNNHPEQDIYFVLDHSSNDWSRLSAEGFNMLAFGSDEHEAALRSCQKVISSHIDKYVSNYLGPKMLANRHLVFLQHGVTKDNISEWLNSKEAINCLITATPDEYNSIVNDCSPYKFTKKDVVLTGFPRHDALLLSKHRSERLIVIMPTWRKTLVGDVINGNERLLNPNFMQSDFAQHWFDVLHSPSLKHLAEQTGFKVAFYPHANITPYLTLFNVPDYIEVMSNSSVPIQEVFARAAMMITDYSSVAFDMAILDKPSIYYQFDEDQIFSGGHAYTKGYFDYRKHGFGPVVTNQQELFVELEKMLFNNGKPSEELLARISLTFPYRDGNNCERVYQAVVALDAPRNPETVNLPVLLDYAEQASKAKIWPLAERRWSQLYALMDETYHSATCLGLATSLRNQGKISEAWSHFDEYEARQAMRNQPLTGEALAEKAELLMASGNWVQAAQIWAELQLSGEGYIPTRHLHCQLALEDWTGVSQQISSPAFSLLSMHEQICCNAVIDSAKGEWQQVIEPLSEVITSFTADELRTLKPELLLAQAYRELGDFDAAHQQLLGFEKHTKSDSICRREIALLAFARGDFTKAYKQLALAFPNLQDLPLSLAATYLKSLRKAKQIDLAIDIAVWLRANHQTDVNIMTEAGKIALAAQRWEVAVDIWESLIGKRDGANYKVALALRMLGDIESAQKYLDDSNTRLPCCMDEWILKAETAQLNGRWQQAAMCWRELLRLYPSHAPSYCWDRMQAALLLANSGTISPAHATH